MQGPARHSRLAVRAAHARVSVQGPDRLRLRNRERGSVLVVTLLAFVAMAGAFIYIAAIGKRADARQQLHSVGGSAAMAAATIKARTFNYAAYLLLAESLILPLGQVSENIVSAQESFLTLECTPCFVAGENCSLFEKCVDYVELASKTKRQQPEVDLLVDTWLDTIEELAGSLDTIGPIWAELEAVSVGETPGGPGSCAAQVAVFPLPDSGPSCGRLGIDLVDNQESVEGMDACHAKKELELAYLTALKDSTLGTFNVVGMGQIGKLLTTGAGCSKRQKAPRLAEDWWRYRISRGMALCEQPGGKTVYRYLQAFSGAQDARTPQVGALLGKGCAEHYSQDHYDHPSLWHMDWRARKVPCSFDTVPDEKNQSVSGIEQVLSCGGVSAPAAARIQQQFAHEIELGAVTNWKY